MNPHSELLPLAEGMRKGGYGFPSGHGANTFGVMVMLARIIRLRIVAITLLIWAFLNCYSRLWFCVNYPLDILVGAVLGALLGYFFSIYIYRILALMPDSAGRGRLNLVDRLQWVVPGTFILLLIIFSIAAI